MYKKIYFRNSLNINFFHSNSSRDKSISLFLILSNLYKKIPNWLKIIFKLLLLLIVIIKLLGFNSFFDFFIKKSFLNFTDKLRLNVYFSSTSTGFNNNISNLGPYLAGLFEGDGHIWIRKQKGTKKHNPRFCITFGLKNEPLCKKLLDIIGSGFIRYKHSENACVLVISPVVGLKKIVNFIKKHT